MLNNPLFVLSVKIIWDHITGPNNLSNLFTLAACCLRLGPAARSCVSACRAALQARATACNDNAGFRLEPELFIWDFI